MIYVTETGSVYEVDTVKQCARRLSGKGNPTTRTGTDGQWKEYVSINTPTIGKPLVIHWKNEKAFIEGAEPCTITSHIVQIIEPN